MPSATPSTTAKVTGGVSSTFVPTPNAMIDSPSARMMMRLWRSAKCIGMSDHPPIPINAPAKSSTIATAQSAVCGPGSRNDAPTSKPIATALLAANTRTVCRSVVLSRPGTRNSAT